MAEEIEATAPARRQAIPLCTSQQLGVEKISKFDEQTDGDGDFALDSKTHGLPHRTAEKNQKSDDQTIGERDYALDSASYRYPIGR